MPGSRAGQDRGSQHPAADNQRYVSARTNVQYRHTNTVYVLYICAADDQRYVSFRPFDINTRTLITVCFVWGVCD